MAEYIDKNKIPWTKIDSPEGKYWAKIVFESTINEIKPEDVVECSKIDKAIREIEQYNKYINVSQNADITKQEVAERVFDICKKQFIQILKRNIEE